MSSRVAEQVPAGINSLPRGQSMAAPRSGSPPRRPIVYILLPIAYRIILPPLTSEFLNTIKNTAVALTIGLIELTGEARSMQEFSFQVFEAFTAATVIYLLINVVVVIAMRLLERASPSPAPTRGNTDVRQFRLRRHPPLVRLSVPRRHDVHADADGDRGARRPGLRHPDRDDAAVADCKLLGRIAGSYVNLMRSLPLVLVIFWFYFLVPYIGQWIIGASRPIRSAPSPPRSSPSSLFEAAYFSEIMRAGIQSIPQGQPAAAYALGLNYSQTMRYVVLPQAFRNMLPVIFTQTIVLFQDTSLVYVLSITDFLGAASKVAQRDGRLVEMYLFAALVYFLISFTASFFVRRLQARIAIVR